MTWKHPGLGGLKQKRRQPTPKGKRCPQKQGSRTSCVASHRQRNQLFGWICHFRAGCRTPDTDKHPSLPGTGKESTPQKGISKHLPRRTCTLAWFFVWENCVLKRADTKEFVSIIYLDFLKAVEKASLIGGYQGQAGKSVTRG